MYCAPPPCPGFSAFQVSRRGRSPEEDPLPGHLPGQRGRSVFNITDDNSAIVHAGPCLVPCFVPFPVCNINSLTECCPVVLVGVLGPRR